MIIIYRYAFLFYQMTESLHLKDKNYSQFVLQTIYNYYRNTGIICKVHNRLYECQARVESEG
jgi:hypothetical protein